MHSRHHLRTPCQTGVPVPGRGVVMALSILSLSCLLACEHTRTTASTPTTTSGEGEAGPARVGMPDDTPVTHRLFEPSFEEILALPDDAVVEADGMKITARTLRAWIEEDDAAVDAAIERGARAAQVHHERRLQRLAEARAERLAEAHAMMDAYLASLRDRPGDLATRDERLALIRTEAAALKDQLAAAGDDEAGALRERAAKLLAEIARLAQLAP